MVKGSSGKRKSSPAPRSSFKSDLQVRLSEKMMKKDVIRMARSVGTDGKILLKFSLLDHAESANRASWTFREWGKQNKKHLPALFNDILKVLLKTSNPSVIRNLSGVWIDHGYPPGSDGKVVDFAFRQFEKYGQPVAVYANMLGILAPALKRHPELIQEFLLITREHPFAESYWFKARMKGLINQGR